MTPIKNQSGDTDIEAKGNVPAEGILEQITAELATYKKTLNEIYELYDKKIEELSLIRRIGDSVRTPLELETLCRHIVDVVAQEISVDRVALLIGNDQGENIQIRASYDSRIDQTQYHHGDEPSPPPRALETADRALKTGGPVLMESASPDLDPLSTGDASPVSLLFLPLIARDRPVGLLSLSRSGSHPFDQDDSRVLTILSDQAAIALANVRLFKQLTEANVALRESERQARQTSLYLESLLEAANDVIFTVNQEGRITYVNRKAGDWGFAKDDLLDQPFHALVDDKGPDPLTAGQTVESTLITKTGEPRNVLFSTSRVIQKEPSYLVLARDITERKHLEKQLFHSEKLASIGILAAGVAHEIGNPLSAISGYTQILQSGEAESEEAREYLTAIEDQAARIQRIIEDLLSYSRPTAGHQSRINLNEAIPQILSMLQSQRTFKNLQVEYSPANGPLEVEMDRDHLAQLIVNISLNAAQAMPEGGSLAVDAERREDQAVIRLSDTGPGIPAEIQSRIFDPFFTTKTAGQGTGLGLAICHRIVESLKGAIQLVSDADSGTTFTITLPAADVVNDESE
jgi:PAS domain S-box-containing protein